MQSWHSPACSPRTRPRRTHADLKVIIRASPTTFDPRVGTDEQSQRVHQLVYSQLMTIDPHLRVAPGLAARLDNPDPLTYIAHLRSGVKFHDGHELTAKDVVYTFSSFLDPDFVSARKGAYRMLAVRHGTGRLPGRVQAEGAVRLISHSARHAGRARRRRRIAARRSRSAPDRTGSSATSWTSRWSCRPSRATGTACRRTPASCCESFPTTRCAGSSCARARPTSPSTTSRPTSRTSCRRTA